MFIFQKQLDPNIYSTKKTVAQGMLDIALLSANASQLRYVLQVLEISAFCILYSVLRTQSQYSGSITQYSVHSILSPNKIKIFLYYQVGESNENYLPMIMLIVTSIILQVRSDYCS